MRIYTTESVVYIRIHYAVYIHECVKYYNILNMCIYIYITQIYLIPNHTSSITTHFKPGLCSDLGSTTSSPGRLVGGIQTFELMCVYT